MKILMFTNTFPPHVGGVAHSVACFMEDYRRLGHRVLVVAPIFPGTPEKEKGVVRIPAIQNFNGSDFSVRLPIPSFLFPKLDGFKPDIIHSHHPFLLGDTALRVAAWKKAPLVFTHHTMYERYTHYVPGDSPQMKRFAKELSTGYANLSDAVIAPSQSIADILQSRGVETPITEIPTGVDLSEFEKGDGADFRKKHGIPGDAFVVGHLGRLAAEKNLIFLARAMNRFLNRHPGAHAVIGGSGPLKDELDRIFAEGGNLSRYHSVGMIFPADRRHAYHAMNVFTFASHTETQGMVLTEAQAAGVPLVALDAPGVREVVRDRINGRLIAREDPADFARAITWIKNADADRRENLKKAAAETARRFSRERSAQTALQLYRILARHGRKEREVAESTWWTALNLAEAEWELWTNRAQATRAALSDDENQELAGP